MNYRCIATTLAFGLVCLPQLSVGSGLGSTIKISTLGPGMEIEGRINDNVGIRGSFNYLPFTVSVSAEDVDYDADFSWKTGGAMIDLYPFSGIFRITAGLFYNGNDVDISATPSKNVTIGDNSYSPSQVGSINGSLSFNTIAPYAGIGWSGGDPTSGNWTVNFDLGILFQGSASVDELYGSGGLAGSTALNADLEKEKSDIEDEMEPYKYYPVIGIGLSYYW